MSCVVVSPSGTTCFQHTTYQPAERVMLDQTCGGSFHDDSCDDDNAIGACHLIGGAETVIYTGYQNVDGFVTVCKAGGGSWEPN